MAPTNPPAEPGAERALIGKAKVAIADGDRAQALALLDALRHAPADDGRQLAPILAEALVATARGEAGDMADGQVLAALQEARAALRQILAWLTSLPFDAEDLAEIDRVMAARREEEVAAAARQQQDRVVGGHTLQRALGAGWLEWRWVGKPSGQQFGPYVYYRWREDGRKRARYVGKVGA
jgi:hypothetical protein